MLLSDTNTLLSAHKANSVAHHFLIQFQTRVFQVTSYCCMLLRWPIVYTECHTHRKNTLHVSLWCLWATGANKLLTVDYQGQMQDFWVGGGGQSREAARIRGAVRYFLVHELKAKLCSHCCAKAGSNNIAVMYGFRPDFSFSFFRCNSSCFRSFCLL